MHQREIATHTLLEVSVHSRAARRGNDTTADLRRTARVEETEYKPWLHNAQNAGIGKKKKGKRLTHGQRVRQQKGLDNAERNMDKMEKKVANSKQRGKKVKARRVDWSELNDEIAGKENRDEKTADQSADANIEGGKEMEGVEMMPADDDSLPIQVPENQTKAIDPEPMAAVEPSGTGPTQVSGNDTDLDKIT